jgi:hypothetical protein
MATLVSPGVSVTLTNESFYATAGQGTVPLVVIATAQNKFQPGSSTAIASGTIKSNAGKLYLVTSQRDALQTFGAPTFYSVAGTPQYDNELNELGLFALYEYLGIANSAYVMRADIDLAQLAPSTTEPAGLPRNGDYWLDLSNSSFGLFKSNGNSNSAFAWNSVTPFVISSASDLEKIVQGNTDAPVVNASAPLITSDGSLYINGIEVPLTEEMSITAVKDAINTTQALTRMGIVASIFARSKKFYPDGTTIDGRMYGDVYNLRLTVADTTMEIYLDDSDPSVLSDIGFDSTDPVNQVLPKAIFGQDGDFAVDVYSVDENGTHKNQIWQKISQVTSSSTNGWWFKVGSIDANYPGWGWREATPRIISGSIPNPTFVAGESVDIAVNGGIPFTVTVSDVSPAVSTLDVFISDLNAAFNAEAVNLIAKKNTIGNNSYLQIINYDGTDTWLHDNSLADGTKHPLLDAGINTAQAFFGSVTGTVSNPTFTVDDVFHINIGGGDIPVTVTGTTIDDLISDVNSAPAFAAFVAAGINVASKVTSGANNYLKISNPNGTTFTLKDIKGIPMNTAGIPVGYSFAKQLIYKGYSPALTVPNTAPEMASENIWLNTSVANRGANFVVRQYANGTWVRQNIFPNTGTIPMYRDTSSADTGFGASKSVGTIFMLYNSENVTPAEADHVLMIWDGTVWLELEYTPSVTSPMGPPSAGTFWYNTDLKVDIMVSTGQVWRGYLNVYPGTDPNGPILSASAPLRQSDNTPLADYDIWIDTSDVENYPMIYRYTVATRSWTLVDSMDQSSAAGIIFTDARNNANGLANGSTIPSVMAVSDYVDPDAPNAELYPAGLLLFNTRYSTNNVKVWTPNYLREGAYRDRWVTASGNKPDGTPYMGHWAQRNMVVQALKATLQANLDVRAEQTFFNLMATPGYTECLPDMVELNTDKKEIAFIIGDTPARLTPDGTSLQRWASNSNNAAMDGPDGLITRNDYAGVYYPWAISTNLDGSSVFVPPSVIALRTYAYNDQVAYPWFAPAGFNRGLVTGVSSVGYLTADNTYQPVQLSQGQRDVMYANSMNPIAYIPNRGLVVYGQKTLSPVASAMDRVNVARLINYLKYELDNLAKPYLFEPNDVQTRQAVTTTFSGFMGNLVGLRALYDFAVVCDETNNTPVRIDRNELWIDIAIKPEKAIEFIYIPIRLLNTGDPLPNANRT